MRVVLRSVSMASCWILGVAGFALLCLLRLTCRIQIEGRPLPREDGGCIYAFWHSAWFVWMVAFGFLQSTRAHAWLLHPVPYMGPIRIMVRLMGVRIVPGSSGHDGRQAAAGLVELLRGGWSTAISPDGPNGPPRTLRKGVLHLAVQSGTPIVPVRCEAHPSFHLRSWDRKIVPIPFGRIRVIFGPPLLVEEQNFSGSLIALGDNLSDQP